MLEGGDDDRQDDIAVQLKATMLSGVESQGRPSESAREGRPVNYSMAGSSMRFSSTAAGLAEKSEITKSAMKTEQIEEIVKEEEVEEAETKTKTADGSVTQSTHEPERKAVFAGRAPLAKTWWIQRIFFTWLTPLVDHTNRRGQISVKEYGLLREQDQIERYIEKLRRRWLRRAARPNAGNINSLFWALMGTFKWELLFWLALSETSVLITMVQPLAIQVLITYIKDGVNAWEPYGIHFYEFPDGHWMSWLTPAKQYGLSVAMILVLSQSVRYVIDENTQFGQNILGAKASGALIGLVYEKNLRVYPSSTSEFSQGEIVNFVQTDCSTVYGLMQWFPFFLCLPLMLVICLYLIFATLGVSFFACVGVFVVGGLVTGVLAKRIFKYHKEYMAKQDKRLNITTECLNNIKMVKLYAWIDIFLRNIDDRRTEELSVYKTKLWYNISMIMVFYFMPAALQSTAFTVFIGMGHTLDLSSAFFLISVFSIIQLPLRIIPMFVGYLTQFLVSLKRIQRFLLLEEINSTIVSRDQAEAHTALEDAQVAACLRGGSNFIWGLKKKKEGEGDEDDHKAVLEARKGAKKGKKNGSAKRDKEGKNHGSEQALLATAERSREAEPEVVRLGNLTVLKRMNVSFEKGKLVCVIGDVGSGKSSLLSALLGDLQYLDSHFVEKEQDQDVGSEEVQKKVKKEAQQKATRGQEPILVNQSISYVQQAPWIQNKTIRDNITFGYEFDRKRYNRVIQICELTRDLEILPSGDQTEIGEKGINLSGGQKARVGLARAVYANKDMILMDDPISALDANVKKKIFENVFLGELRKKTRVLVTHAVDFLHLVDTIILLKDGEVLLQGSYEEIKDEPYLEKLMEIHKQHQSEQSKLNNAGEELQPLKPMSQEPVLKFADDEEELLQISQATAPLEVTAEKSVEALNLERAEQAGRAKKKGRIIEDENEETIEVSFAIYKQYFMKYYGGCWYIFLSQLGSVFFLVTLLGNNYVIGEWSRSDDQLGQFAYYASLTYGMVVAQCLGIVLRAGVNQIFSWHATRKLHRRMIDRVLRAPVNLYFDTTPIGRILNRFSKDLNTMECGFADQIGGFLAMAYTLLYVIVVAVLAVAWVGLLLPVIFIISYFLVRRTVKPIKETARVQSTTKSPVLSHLGETISGASTIRAFDKVEEFIKKNNELLNDQVQATYMTCGVSGWFGIKVDILSFFLMIVLYVVCILSRDVADPVILAMLITSVLAIQDNLMWSLKTFMQIHNTMVSAARCMKLIEVPQERAVPATVRASAGYPLGDRNSWPEQGVVEFKNVSLRYRPTTEIVLHDLSFSINSGEKIGIVGRTGAGKSTICLAISRIVEIFEGQILIDNVNIQDIDLQDLRSRVTLIPQDPTMFTGTLRFNLDPEERCSDEQIAYILQQGQLQSLLDADPKGLYQEITDNGGNLSSGERQLICICRAILRKSKLVVLDEATANIDMLTEERIQNLISTQFQDSTMITIAHRLNTIINSDRVLVLGYGQILEYDKPRNLMNDKTSEFSKLLQELEKKDEKKEDQDKKED